MYGKTNKIKSKKNRKSKKRSNRNRNRNRNRIKTHIAGISKKKGTRILIGGAAATGNQNIDTIVGGLLQPIVENEFGGLEPRYEHNVQVYRANYTIPKTNKKSIKTNIVTYSIVMYNMITLLLQVLDIDRTTAIKISNTKTNNALLGFQEVLTYAENLLFLPFHSKNRYADIIPHPLTRVVIRNDMGGIGSYINANHIKGFDQDIKIEDKLYYHGECTPESIKDKKILNLLSPNSFLVRKIDDKTYVISRKLKVYEDTETNTITHYKLILTKDNSINVNDILSRRLTKLYKSLNKKSESPNEMFQKFIIEIVENHLMIPLDTAIKPVFMGRIYQKMKALNQLSLNQIPEQLNRKQYFVNNKTMDNSLLEHYFLVRKTTKNVNVGDIKYVIVIKKSGSDQTSPRRVTITLKTLKNKECFIGDIPTPEITKLYERIRWNNKYKHQPQEVLFGKLITVIVENYLMKKISIELPSGMDWDGMKIKTILQSGISEIGIDPDVKERNNNKFLITELFPFNNTTGVPSVNDAGKVHVEEEGIFGFGDLDDANIYTCGNLSPESICTSSTENLKILNDESILKDRGVTIINVEDKFLTIEAGSDEYIIHHGMLELSIF